MFHTAARLWILFESALQWYKTVFVMNFVYVHHICSCYNRKMMIPYQNTPGQISITFDSWTSGSMDPFLSVTAHYIAVKPEQWTLKSQVLAYTHIEGNHSGANTASVLLRVIDRYDIRPKVRIVTTITLSDTHSYQYHSWDGRLPIMRLIWIVRCALLNVS